MSTQLEEAEQAGGSTHRAATLTPQASRLLEGPVLPTLLRLAAPTVALMLHQGVVAAGEAAFVGRLGSDALAGVSLSFPLVMLMTTLSAGAYGGGVASGVARALGAGRDDDATRLAGTALGMSAILGLASTAAMLLFGPAFYAALGATGPALEAAVLYSDVLFLGAVPSWLFNAAASVLLGGGNTAYPAAAGAAGGVVTLAASPLVIFGAGPVPGLGVAGAAWAVVGYNVAMSVVLLVPCGRPAHRRGQASVRSCRGGVTLLGSCAWRSRVRPARCSPTSRSSSSRSWSRRSGRRRPQGTVPRGVWSIC